MSIIQLAHWLDLQGHVSSSSQPTWCAAQVAIVLFRTLVEFYDTPLGLSTLPLIVWRFATIGIGSILTGKHLPVESFHECGQKMAGLQVAFAGGVASCGVQSQKSEGVPQGSWWRCHVHFC